MKIVWLFLAGGCGTLARYGVSAAVQRATGAVFPWGTFTVNVLGCFLAGSFWAFAESRLTVTGEMRAVILIGFIGGFTTFSAFMLESSHLMRDTEWLWFGGNILLSNLAGFAAVVAGLALGRLL
ncbi:MAG TPA: CrcB family protein [Candidatus Brocadiia bacterium]|nr:CrcB family protein [Candidatus Brocadiia bacterium]